MIVKPGQESTDNPDALVSEALADLAHWLKGAGGTVGFDELTEPALTLEEISKQRKAGEVDAAIEALREIAARIQSPSGGGS